MGKEKDINFYNVSQICEMFDNKLSKGELIEYFEQGKIKGEKIELGWTAEKTAINSLMELLAKERMKILEKQTINLTNIKINGRILDIGGGGEGVIGQLIGEKVVVIDLKKKELESGLRAGDTKSLKIIMDAKDLKFLDKSFDTITAFFSMMYMKKENLKKVFEEIFRVLKINGELIIWDIIIPDRRDSEKDFFGLYLNIKIGEKHIDTGYATFWDKEQDIKDYLKLAKSAGFSIKEQSIEGNTFFIKCRKDLNL